MGKNFYQYMMQFLGEDSLRGTLAEDMHYEQERSPFRNCDLNELRTWSQMNSYLNTHNAWDESRWTAKCCWQDYIMCSPCQGQLNLAGWKTEPEEYPGLRLKTGE